MIRSEQLTWLIDRGATTVSVVAVLSYWDDRQFCEPIFFLDYVDFVIGWVWLPDFYDVLFFLSNYYWWGTVLCIIITSWVLLNLAKVLHISCCIHIQFWSRVFGDSRLKWIWGIFHASQRTIYIRMRGMIMAKCGTGWRWLTYFYGLWV